MQQGLNVEDAVQVSSSLGSGGSEAVSIRGHYELVCRRKGVLVWEDEITNLITNLGRNSILQSYFKGSGYNAELALGIINANPTISVTDAMSAKAWSEVVDYDELTRANMTNAFDAAVNQAIVNSSPIRLTMNATNTLGGLFTVSGAAREIKGDVSANSVLISAGAFTGGNRGVQAGDTIDATISFSF